MSQKIIIVEDQFIEANSLKLLLNKEGYTILGIADTVEKALDLIKEERPDFVLVDIFLKGHLTGIDLAVQLKKDNIPFIYISANSNEEVLNLAKATQPDGFVVKPFRKKDVLVTLSIANYRYQNNRKTELKLDNDLEQQLIKIINGNENNDRKLLQMVSSFQSFIPFDLFTIRTHSDYLVDGNSRNFLRVAFDEYQLIGAMELMTIANITVEELQNLKLHNYTEPSFGIGEDFIKLGETSSMIKLLHSTFEMKSYLSFPIRLNNGELCYICFLSKRENAYNQDHLMAFKRSHTFIYKAVELIRNDTVPEMLPNTDTAKSRAAINKPAAVNPFKGIIGSSHLLLNVFDQISQVAGSDTSVLILGESGTGKEKVADAIHNLSQRADKPIIRVNCAALPATLIESELFGHEKGAFTGANEKRIGKFEQADTGTIFLDEIGEMPIELQVKLLRVLQEREIERLGSRAPTKLNVRIIAATSRNLEKEVAAGRFRLDLYYRLNVFPIVLPPLRERKDDIPELVQYFIGQYNYKTGKNVEGITDRCLAEMNAYSWPGNIRELEHVIERNILMAKGNMLENILLTPVAKREFPIQADEVRIKTIQENERDHILNVLRKCNGKIWGPGAAAEMLNIPASTLKSKMKKLGIQKDYQVN